MPTKTTSSAEWIPPYSSTNTECPSCGYPGDWYEDEPIALVQSGGGGYDAICTLNCSNEECDQDPWQFEATVRDNFSIPDEPCDKCGSDDGEFEPDIDSADVNGDYITVEGEFHCYTCDEDDDAKPVSPPEKWEDARWSNFELDREQLSSHLESRGGRMEQYARGLADIKVEIPSPTVAWVSGGFANSKWRFDWVLGKQDNGDYYAPAFAIFWDDAALDEDEYQDADKWIGFNMNNNIAMVEASFLPEQMPLSSEENRRELKRLINENFGSLFSSRLDLYGFNPFFVEPIGEEWKKPYPHASDAMIDSFVKHLAWMDQYGLRRNPSGNNKLKTIGLLAGGAILGWFLKDRLD